MIQGYMYFIIGWPCAKRFWKKWVALTVSNPWQEGQYEQKSKNAKTLYHAVCQ